MSQFIFMRHAQSTANLRRLCAGASSDHPLTPKGQLQAMMAAQTLRKMHLPISRIIHSPQPRAHQTALICAHQLGLMLQDMHSDEELREQHFGAWEGRVIDELEHEFAHRLDPPEGESKQGLRQRILRATARIVDLATEDATRLTLVVSHGVFWHEMYHYFDEQQARHGSNTPWLDNAHAFSVTIKEQQLHLQELVSGEALAAALHNQAASA